MKVIVNADDYGNNEVGTNAISEAFRTGLLSQTTTMVNMPWFVNGVSLAKQRGFFQKVGLHFNLTEGVPLSRGMQECDFFCDDKGHFKTDFHLSLKTRMMIPARFLPILRKEAKCQIERYLDAGYTLKHLDSHHHVHTDFSIARVLLPLARDYGFRTCRISRTISSCNVGVLTKIYKILFNTYLKRYMRPLSDDMTDFNDFRMLFKSISQKTTVEIMVHPGAPSEHGIQEQLAFLREAAISGVEIIRYA